MKNQLTLLDAPQDWRLSEETRELGRRGVARARAALAAGTRANPGTTDDRSHRDRRTAA